MLRLAKAALEDYSSLVAKGLSMWRWRGQKPQRRQDVPANRACGLGGQGLGHICLLTITHESVVVTAADCVRADSQMGSSAATNLAWRPRPRDKATRGGRLPRLVRLVLSCSCRSGRGRLGRSGSFFCCSFGQCGRRSCVVLLETAVFIFATRAAMTGLVAPGSCTGRSSH